MLKESPVLGLDQVRRLIAEEDPAGQLPPCGLAELVVGPDALDLVAPLVARLIDARLGTVALVVDETVIRRRGEDVKERVATALADVASVTRVVLSDGHPELHVTEPVIEDAARQCAGADVIVALGGGTISDIGKLAAARHPGTRLVTIMTAASVDGYTDDVSVILKDGVKRTVPSVWPDAVLADAETVAEAPSRMNQAGYGEMVSMYVAPADWRLAALVGVDTSFHRAPIAILETLGRRLDACAAGVGTGDPAAVQELTLALALRGIATGIAGTTACLSGVEHLISHMLDLRAAALHLPTGLHGEQVGVGSVVAASAWEMLHERMSTAPHARVQDAFLDPATAEVRVRTAFDGIDPSGRISDECWSDYSRKLSIMTSAREQIDEALAGWSENEALLRSLARPSRTIATGLRASGAPAQLAELGPDVDDATARWAVANSALMRARFTVIDLLTLLGWWDDEAVDEVLDRAHRAVSLAEVSS